MTPRELLAYAVARLHEAVNDPDETAPNRASARRMLAYYYREIAPPDEPATIPTSSRATSTRPRESRPGPSAASSPSEDDSAAEPPAVAPQREGQVQR
jgi:hypothetical protein